MTEATGQRGRLSKRASGELGDVTGQTDTTGPRAGLLRDRAECSAFPGLHSTLGGRGAGLGS